MIGSLRGVVLERSDTTALVEVAGVGYRVQMTPAMLSSLGSTGSEAFLHIYHHIREDSQTLFGFTDSAGREVFEILLGTHGVGPSLALAILATHSPSSLVRIVADGDVTSMCLVPGVGKKTAERLMIELKNRLGAVSDDSAAASLEPDSSRADTRSDIREALGGLGYSPEEIAAVLPRLDSELDVSGAVRQALQLLAGR